MSAPSAVSETTPPPSTVIVAKSSVFTAKKAISNEVVGTSGVTVMIPAQLEPVYGPPTSSSGQTEHSESPLEI